MQSPVTSVKRVQISSLQAQGGLRLLPYFNIGRDIPCCVGSLLLPCQLNEGYYWFKGTEPPKPAVPEGWLSDSHPSSQPVRGCNGVLSLSERLRRSDDQGCRLGGAPSSCRAGTIHSLIFVSKSRMWLTSQPRRKVSILATAALSIDSRLSMK
jgi:hypothetical protein